MGKLVGLDTNIFIYHYQKHPRYIANTRLLFTNLIEEKITAVTSVITLTELLSFKAKEKEIERIRDAFFSTPHLTILPIEFEIAIKAAEIRRAYSYRLPDAIQLATAISEKADVFITNDRRLKGFKELKIKLLNEVV